MTDLVNFEDAKAKLGQKNNKRIKEYIDDTLQTMQPIEEETKDFTVDDYVNAIWKDYLKIKNGVYSELLAAHFNCLIVQLFCFDIFSFGKEHLENEHYHAYEYSNKWNRISGDCLKEWSNCFERDFAYLKNVINRQDKEYYYDAIENLIMLSSQYCYYAE